MNTHRQEDVNGFITIKDNPISKVGVFPYLGREIGAPEPDRVYQVYRPEEELSNPETIASFNLLPWINDHTVLGKDATPAEDVGVQGTTGQNAYFEYPYLKNDLRIYTNFLRNQIDVNKKIELSPSYRFKTDFTSGVFEGHKYDAIQRHIRGNHLALVDEGRTGKDVAVLDHKPQFITIDTAELLPMTPEEIKALVAQAVAEALAAQQAPATDEDVPEEKKPATDEDTTEEEKPASDDLPPVDANPAKDDDTDVTATPASEPVAPATVAEVVEAVQGLQEKIGTVGDANTIAKRVQQTIAAKDALVKRLVPHTGVFATDSMFTAQDVAEYGVKKLGIKASKGAELATLNGYLQVAKSDSEKIIATDSKTVTASGVKQTFWGAK